MALDAFKNTNIGADVHALDGALGLGAHTVVQEEGSFFCPAERALVLPLR